jgi:signal transduction histidine kinase
VRLRWKITLTVTVVSALVAVVLSLIVHYAFARQQAGEARRLQADRLGLVLNEYARTGVPAFGGRIDDPALPPGLREPVRRGQTATLLRDAPGGGADIWAAAPAQGHVLSLRSDYRPQLNQLASLDRVLLAGSLAVLLCGAAAGVMLGDRLSRRLRRAAAAARRVAGGERGTRVEAAIGGRGRDEAAELAHAVDAMTDALQGRIDAERRVTADIAHELRTPLTGLTTAAELLPPGRPAELVRDRVAVLRRLVEDVLEVARLDTATERPDLSQVALGAFTTRRAVAIAPGAQVHVTREATVNTDPRRLERILTNLLTNAERHGAPPVVVEVDAASITVRDHGPGFPERLLTEGPSRFRKGEDDAAHACGGGHGGGHGLGLTIAAGQAAVLGADLTFANPPDGGASATLTLSTLVYRP